MKKIAFALFSVLIIFTACKKNNEEPPPDVVHDLSNLVASPDFDWETTRNVHFTIFSEKTTIIHITSVDGNILYYNGFYCDYDSIHGSHKVSISFPKYVDEVTINSVPVSIINDNVEFLLSKKNRIFNNSYNSANQKSGKDGLISSWHFNENSGTTLFDSEDGNNGTIYGATWTDGISGSALKFNGTDDYVLVPDAENLNITQSLSIMAWVNFNSLGATSNFNGIVAKWCHAAQGGTGWGYGLFKAQITNKIAFATASSAGGGYADAYSNSVPTLHEWCHVAGTYDGTTMLLYINGELQNDTGTQSGIYDNEEPVTIGSFEINTTDFWFNGEIDEVSIWNIALSAEEVQAIYNSQLNTDTDGDGVPDIEDAYPNDPNRAFNNFFPSGNYASLAFEDLWPGIGDYDFNDLVLDYQFKTVTSASNKITEIYGNFAVCAIGAGLSNGFGFQFPNNNIQAGDITVSGYDLQDNYISLNANGTEAGQDKTTIIVFDNAYNIIQPISGFGVNVYPEYPYVEPDTVAITMVFTQGIYSMSDIDIINFNPFLIIDETRGKEVHLADYPPTSLVDDSYFGTMDDDSNPGTGRYYKTVNNLPWAINIAESFVQTIEKVEITNGYLKFYEWAASSGAIYPDWYMDKAG
ncbi:MAG: LruC domain-containing protein, partial [Bacteroidales bacterium]|nr:LruC domain-containing protein [Bacteroidales bacterium]